MEQLGYYAQIIMAGMGGALVRSLVVHRGSILLWHKWEKNGARGIDLGILSSLIIGASVGLMVDQSPMTAFSWAITGSFLVEELIKAKATGELVAQEEKTCEEESRDA